MTDLLSVLPDFPAERYTHVLPSLERNNITLSDLLTLDAVDIAKRGSLPAAEIRKLTGAVLETLHRQLGFSDRHESGSDAKAGHDGQSKHYLATNGEALANRWDVIRTLDDRLDAALGGGIPTRYLTELTGESGAGKTQFLLSLLLSVQLPPPHGLKRSALYISTESALQTSRLTQILAKHPFLSNLPSPEKPSLSRILSIQTPDLESQDHILRYQVPVVIHRHGIGLLVIDSIAANYRAEFDRPGSASKAGAVAMAKRSQQLVQLGSLLRGLARTNNIAVVVANQVADRFSPTSLMQTQPPHHSQAVHPTPSSAVTTGPPAPSASNISLTSDPLTLDHQQRWFTGWGDRRSASSLSCGTLNLKTPSLGLVWTNQISCRIALLKEAVYSTRDPLEAGLRRGEGTDVDGGRETDTIRWRRWMKVVFAAWAPGHDGGKGVEFEIGESGICSVASQ